MIEVTIQTKFFWIKTWKAANILLRDNNIATREMAMIAIVTMKDIMPKEWFDELKDLENINVPT